jgi:hypothetical protein
VYLVLSLDHYLDNSISCFSYLALAAMCAGEQFMWTLKFSEVAHLPVRCISRLRSSNGTWDDRKMSLQKNRYAVLIQCLLSMRISGDPVLKVARSSFLSLCFDRQDKFKYSSHEMICYVLYHRICFMRIYTIQLDTCVQILILFLSGRACLSSLTLPTSG